MGHIHLRVLPRTRKWRSVVALLDGGGSDDEVIAASAAAAERDLLSATGDPVYVEAVRLLLTIPHAARQSDFGQSLRDADLEVRHRPELLDIVSAVSRRLDQISGQAGKRSDLGEIAARALTRTLFRFVGGALPGLLETTPEDVRVAARRLSYASGIAALTRGFFAEVVGASLSYWLDRTLANRIGPEGRFAGVPEREAFDQALGQFTFEATRIIQEFAGGWYGKTLHEHGGFDRSRATVFGAVALKKIVEELRQKGTIDA